MKQEVLEKTQKVVLNIFLLIGVFFFPLAQAQTTPEKKSSYRYIIDNYFSKRSYETYFDRSFSLSTGFSFYRVNSKRDIKDPYSIYLLSFTQNVHTLDSLGDVHLRASVVSTQMKRGKALFFELNPLILFPEQQTRFPLYLGLGLGLGFSPFYLVEGRSPFSLQAPFLFGLRFFNLYHNLGAGGEISLKVHYPFHEAEVLVSGISRLYLIFNF